MASEKLKGFMTVVRSNQMINQRIPALYRPKFFQRLEQILSEADPSVWESEEGIRNTFNKPMSELLCEHQVPRYLIGKIVDECVESYIKNGADASKVSKITGKVMSDSYDKSFATMKKQLPDILIPDFWNYLGKLNAYPPIAAIHEADWQKRNVYYANQKEHVRGWLKNQLTHGGETFYHRDNLNISSRTSYNHWNNPGMAIWLLEALGEDPDLVWQAGEEAFHEQNVRRRSGIVRKHFPFDRVLELMSKDPDGEKIILRSVEEFERKKHKFETSYEYYSWRNGL